MRNMRKRKFNFKFDFADTVTSARDVLQENGITDTDEIFSEYVAEVADMIYFTLYDKLAPHNLLDKNYDCREVAIVEVTKKKMKQLDIMLAEDVTDEKIIATCTVKTRRKFFGVTVANWMVETHFVSGEWLDVNR